MGTVKYSGPIASFHCPTEATIRSLKVHFSPKQEGSGTPSPENICPIEGWDGVEVNKSGRNLMHLVGYSAVNLNTTTATRKLTNGNGTTINTIDPEKSVTITQTLWPNNSKSSYQNGYFAVIDDNLKFEERYDISFRVTNITNNPLNATLFDLMIYNSKGTSVGNTKIIDGDRITFKNAIYNQNTSTPLRHGFDIRICGMSCTISDFIVTAVDVEDRTYEPYHGSTTNYTFGVLGKNKLDKSSYKYLNSSVICFGGDSSSEPDGSLFLKAGTYTFSVSTTASMIFATDANKKNIVSATNTNTATFTLLESMAVRIGCFIQGATDEEMLAYNYQIELGSTATTYEPYDPNHTVYGGWVDLISGEVQEEQLIWTVDDINFIGGNPDSYNEESGKRFYASWSVGSANDFSDDINTVAKCNILPTVGTTNSSSNAKAINWLSVYKGWGSNTIYGCLSDSVLNNDTSIDNIKAYLKSNDFKVLIKLATPNIYNLPPHSTELKTFLSTNNVWSNADYVEVEYDLHETQNILARKQFIIANQPHVVKPAAASLQNFVTDMAAPLKECKVGFKPIQDLHGYDKPWVGGSGKNLYNSAMDTLKTFIRANEPVGEIVSTTYNYNLSDYIAVEPNTTYTINYNATTDATSAGMVFFGSKNAEDIVGSISLAYQTRLNNNSTSYTFTTDQNCNYLRFSTFPAASNIQLELGSTATSYEPYENICPISGWTGLKVYHSGKNILPITDTRVQNHQQIDFPGGVLSFSSKTSIEGRTPQFIVVSTDGETQLRYWTLTGTENDTKYRDNINTQNIPRYRVNGGAYDVQVELGETHTEYEPFKGSVNTIDWTDEAGTIYGGYVDLVTGEVWKTYYEVNITELGTYRTLGINKNNNTQVSWFLSNHLNAPEATGYVAYSRDGYCSCAPFLVNNYYWDSKCQVNNSTADLIIEGELMAEEVDTWIKAHAPIQIVYPLKTPELITTLTTTQLKSLRGTNNIWASNNGDNIEIAYWKH